jgi:hypothetical protein
MQFCTKKGDDGEGECIVAVPCVTVVGSNSDKHHHTFYKTSTYWDHQAVGKPIQMASIHVTPKQLQKLVVITHSLC